MKRSLCVVLITAAVAWLPSCQGNNPPEPKPAEPEEVAVAAPPEMNTVSERREFGPYTVTVYTSNEPYDSAFTIERGGKPVYETEVKGAVLFPETGNPLQDFTRDGTPDLIVGYFTGGAHCCYRYKIISLGSPVKELLEINSEHSEVLLDDGNSDGISEFYTDDWAFAYWGASFADSVAMPIVLKMDGDRLMLDQTLMRKPPLSRSEWDDRVNAVRDAWADEQQMKILATFQDNEWGPVPVELWATMLELIYTGNGDDAWRFLNAVWPRDNPHREAFRKAFEGQLAKSAYYPDIRALNNW